MIRLVCTLSRRNFISLAWSIFENIWMINFDTKHGLMLLHEEYHHYKLSRDHIFKKKAGINFLIPVNSSFSKWRVYFVPNVTPNGVNFREWSNKYNIAGINLRKGPKNRETVKVSTPEVCSSKVRLFRIKHFNVFSSWTYPND